MDNKELLDALKKAQLVGSKDEISKEHDQLAHWVSQVAPLLLDSDEHYTTFMNAAGKAMARTSTDATIENINIMRSTVESAIVQLESDG
ncbi:acyl-CoA synthetase (AMP-forming)/AMP-acid ligases II [Candidatus Scalindua japonica]|uniref:Acyl-CoA synthetase (AMP-forming)/AMP-acid ligases II n=1 Tax=Candidatus Scalindua japonica TaxID=1284222 RepID=A0A286U013_9BACT|nr:hypothetical protein [Candidatus Scalindua japonica]GAX61466.1 acyl-CoA synthetase (AMP-forming)/AMP-acid ligases II [Candidatus Scalindua japonica]